MINKFRQYRIALLPAILICLVAVNVHATAHLGAGSVECEFCASSHDPSDVIVDSAANSLLLPPAPKPIERQLRQLRVAPFFSFQQRGPPFGD